MSARAATALIPCSTVNMDALVTLVTAAQQQNQL
jgi:hypothetical protein